MKNHHSYIFQARRWISIFTGMVVVFAVSMSSADSLSQQTNQGRRAFDQGDFEKAQKLFQDSVNRDSESTLANYNLGTVLYKQGQYDDAVEHLQKSLLSDDPKLIQKAHYNLGSAHYQSAKTLLEKNPSQAKKELEKSLEHFRQIENNDVDALDNVKEVKKVIDVVEKIEKMASQKGNRGSGEGSSFDDKEQVDSSMKELDSKDELTSEQAKKRRKDDDAKEFVKGDSDKNYVKDNQAEKSISFQEERNKNGVQDQQAQGAGEQKSDQSQKQSSTADATNERKQPEPQPKSEGSSGEKQDSKEDQTAEAQGDDVGNVDGENQELGNEKQKPSDRQASQGGYNGADSKAKDVSGARYEDVNEKRAQRLLEEYRQTEEPQKMLNFFRPSGDQKNDQRDW